MHGRRKLLILLLAALLPTALLAGTLFFYLMRSQQASLQREAISRASETLLEIERVFTTQGELLKLLSRSPSLDGPKPDLAQFHEVAHRFKSQLALWNRVILSDRDGNQIVNTGIPFGRPLLRIVDEDSHERALQTRDLAVGNLAGPGPQADSAPRVSFKVCRSYVTARPNMFWPSRCLLSIFKQSSTPSVSRKVGGYFWSTVQIDLSCHPHPLLLGIVSAPLEGWLGARWMESTMA